MNSKDYFTIIENKNFDSEEEPFNYILIINTFSDEKFYVSNNDLSFIEYIISNGTYNPDNEEKYTILPHIETRDYIIIAYNDTGFSSAFRVKENGCITSKKFKQEATNELVNKLMELARNK